MEDTLQHCNEANFIQTYQSCISHGVIEINNISHHRNTITRNNCITPNNNKSSTFPHDNVSSLPPADDDNISFGFGGGSVVVFSRCFLFYLVFIFVLGFCDGIGVIGWIFAELMTSRKQIYWHCETTNIISNTTTLLKALI